MGGTEARAGYWKEYFRSADSGIFDVIENAILIAASDFPVEFRKRRDRIAELLFSSKCLRCQSETPIASNYSYDEAEALTEEIEEEGQTVGEVLRIREILRNKRDQTEAVLLESLRRLQLMRLSVETLKETEVGKAVNGLKRHRSKQISSFAQTLVEEWMAMANEWMSSAALLKENTPQSADPATFEMEDGLPFPPLDEGALLATQTTPMELSKFFDGMDDDGNPRTIGEFDKIDRKGKTLAIDNSKSQMISTYSPELSDDDDQPEDANVLGRPHEAITRHGQPKELDNRSRRQSEVPNRVTEMNASLGKQLKANSSASPDSGPARNQKPFTNHQSVGDPKLQLQSRCDVQKKPSDTSYNRYSEEHLNQTKFEIAKRKLQEGYQQAQNAKKQRTIQVMELSDLPKQPAIQKVPHLRSGNQTRKWANGRR